MGTWIGWQLNRLLSETEWSQVCQKVKFLDSHFPGWFREQREVLHNYHRDLLTRSLSWMGVNHWGMEAKHAPPIFAWGNDSGLQVTDRSISLEPPCELPLEVQPWELAPWEFRNDLVFGCFKLNLGAPGDLLLVVLAAVDGLYPGSLHLIWNDSDHQKYVERWVSSILRLSARLPRLEPSYLESPNDSAATAIRHQVMPQKSNSQSVGI